MPQPEVRRGGPHLRGRPVKSQSVEFRWPVTAASVRLARRVVEAMCRLWRSPEACEGAALAVSEMVGNSVRAGHGETITLRLDWTPRRLRVEVHDDAPGMPQLTQADPMAESGRGMWIISQLAVRWGTIRKRHGKIVWAEFVLAAPA